MKGENKMKGKLEEIISKARYADDTSKYTVKYRDLEEYPEIGLERFIHAYDDFGEPIEIPLHRIVQIKKEGIVIWQKIGWTNQ